MRLAAIALIFVSFALASADEDPYGVSAPKAADTTIKAPAPVVKDTSSLNKKPVKVSQPVSKKDTVAAQKPRSVKDTVVAKKVVQPAPVDTTAKVKKDSIPVAKVPAVKPADTVSVKTNPAPVKADTTVVKTDTTAPKPRQRIVRETTINTLNEMKGKYRSPKQALFMSLIIPGLGQAYVGQTKFNYVRAAAYFSADIVLGAFWYDYTVVKHDREVRNYQHFADQHWNQATYEGTISQHSSDANFDDLNPSRQTYCNAVTAGGDNLKGCITPSAPEYQSSFQGSITTFHGADSVAQTGNYRAGFPNPFEFYSVIGQEQEFITGWEDASGVAYGSGDSAVISGTSAYRDQYIGMRAQANKYARMQAWFLGGIVLNHIASALDAALTARFHNRALYETESMWYDRLHFDGGLAFDQGWPTPNFKASVTF